ncbi:MAG: ATP-binding protein [Candidatus Woesearchaeota archaeon]
MNNSINDILESDSLVELIQEDNFVGAVYYIDYDKAYVITNDHWKTQVNGIPNNCFLLASAFNPRNYTNTSKYDREVILLRVLGTTELPQDDDLIKTKIDNIQEQENQDLETQNFDKITQNLLQYGGLECSILGTFYKKDNELYLGSDLESFSSSELLRVYRPTGEVLGTVINHINSIKKKKAKEDAEKRGIKEMPDPIKLGTVRYTSTDRLHRGSDEDNVPFYIQPADFLARRTAVLGMTRTGKSNTIKHTISAVKNVADDSNINIGQIIYDMNGEYANPNVQDEDTLSNVFKDTVCYRLFSSEDDSFRGLLNNFYTHLVEGHSIIREIVDFSSTQSDYQNFIQASFEEPPRIEYSEHNRWKVKTAAYKALLYRAGFDPGKNNKVEFSANQNVRNLVEQRASADNINMPNPKNGIKLNKAAKWFEYAKEIEDGDEENLESSSGGSWFDDTTLSIARMIAQKNAGGQYITGYGKLSQVTNYHDPSREKEIGQEIYEFLKQGKIIILDLSVGEPELRKRMGKKIASNIFNKSMNIFIEDEIPPNIVFYIEEAHNMIGKDDDITDVWPRIAKEGAKYELSVVYATQEVSSIHPNILANTENWFVSHLNNKDEIKVLTKFYDFEDFSRSLLRTDDVGFARVKTLSSPFVVPVQIDLFTG